MTEDTILTIALEPIGLDRFSISIKKAGRVIREIRGDDPDGFTETALRDPHGLPQCGLSEKQVEKVIASANNKRTTGDNVASFGKLNKTRLRKKK